MAKETENACKAEKDKLKSNIKVMGDDLTNTKKEMDINLEQLRTENLKNKMR